jgi:translation elongation factor EF-G
MAYASEDIRNVALFGHGHSGKTMLLDAIAHHCKLTNRLGNTADGSSISNTEPEERARVQTLSAHLFKIPVGPVMLNMFDTPGHPDFVADTISAMDVVETACLCVSAASPLTFMLVSSGSRPRHSASVVRSSSRTSTTRTRTSRRSSATCARRSATPSSR